MGIARTTLRLANPVKPHLAGLEVTALADTGAMYLCIPEHVALQLELSEQERREVTLADGSKRVVSYVGPIEVRFANRRCFVGAMVLGHETLLGAMPMQDMDLVIRPLTHEVTVNPASPNIPSTIAKRSDVIAGNAHAGERLNAEGEHISAPERLRLCGGICLRFSRPNENG